MNSGSEDLMGGLVGALLTTGFVSIMFLVVTVAVVAYIWYRIIRAGVRDGMIQAMARTGSTGSVGGSSVAQGYPPDQSYGAPPAPHVE